MSQIFYNALFVTLLWQVDGKMLAQTAAIERYAAKLAGLTPEDRQENSVDAVGPLVTSLCS
jgi:hypothetical protein